MFFIHENKRISPSKIYENISEIKKNEQCKMYHHTNKSLWEFKFKAKPSEILYFTEKVIENPYFKPKEYGEIIPSDFNVKEINEEKWENLAIEDEKEIFEGVYSELKEYEEDRKKWEKVYCVMVLYLSGDDDYGALNAQNYGYDNIINNIIDDREECFEEEDFNVTFDVIIFDTEKDRDNAVRMVYGVINHAVDYDSSKHTDCHVHTLTLEEYVRYMSL